MAFLAFSLVGDGYLGPFLLFAYCILSDIADGWMARRFQVASEIGWVIDLSADKCLTIACLVYALTRGISPIPLLAILLREILSGCLKGLRHQDRLVFLSVKAIGRYIFGGLFLATALLILSPQPLALPRAFFDASYTLVCLGFVGLTVLQIYRARKALRRITTQAIASAE